MCSLIRCVRGIIKKKREEYHCYACGDSDFCEKGGRASADVKTLLSLSLDDKVFPPRGCLTVMS